MKVISRNLWIVLAVVLLVALFVAQVTAAPATQTATATPAPTKARAGRGHRRPDGAGLKDWQGSRTPT